MSKKTPPKSLQKTRKYIVPHSVPHYGGSLFKVPSDKKKAGLVIYASGLQESLAQPMILAVCPDVLFLGNEKRTVWWRWYEDIRRVGLTKVTVKVPVPTPNGGVVGRIMRDAQAVEISFATAYGGGEISLVLITPHPHQAAQWKGLIDHARLAYEDRNEGAMG